MFIKLTDINGAPLLVPSDGIVVQEQPVGQTQVVLPNGSVWQVQETVEQVRQLLQGVA